jgi:hypothetical protein
MRAFTPAFFIITTLVGFCFIGNAQNNSSTITVISNSGTAKVSSKSMTEIFFERYSLLAEANEEAYSTHREMAVKYEAAAKKIAQDKSRRKTALRYLEISKLFNELASHNEALVVYYTQKPTRDSEPARDKAFTEIPKVRDKIVELGGKIEDRTWLAERDIGTFYKNGYKLKGKLKPGDHRLPLLRSLWTDEPVVDKKKPGSKTDGKQPVRRPSK